MATTLIEWDGPDWQAHCERLCRLRHQPGGYQPIPDSDRGDRGLEGHTVDGTGIGYQCYAPQAGLKIADRRNRQKAKITSTISDVISNHEDLAGIVGSHTVRAIHFLFPEHDSRFVNSHLREQETRLRQAVHAQGIKWMAADVCLVVQTDDDFLTEKAELLRTTFPGVPLSDYDPTDDEVSQYSEAIGEQFPAARDKLAAVLTPIQLARSLDIALKDRIVGASLERELEERDPITFQSFAVAKQRERRRVERESAEGATVGMKLAALRERTSGRFFDSVAGVTPADADRLADGAVAQWLLECPLYFPELP